MATIDLPRPSNDDRHRPAFGHPSREVTVKPTSSDGVEVTALLSSPDEVTLSFTWPGAPDEDSDYSEVTMTRAELLELVMGGVRLLTV